MDCYQYETDKMEFRGQTYKYEGPFLDSEQNSNWLYQTIFFVKYSELQESENKDRTLMVKRLASQFISYGGKFEDSKGELFYPPPKRSAFNRFLGKTFRELTNRRKASVRRRKPSLKNQAHPRSLPQPTPPTNDKKTNDQKTTSMDTSECSDFSVDDNSDQEDRETDSRATTLPTPHLPTTSAIVEKKEDSIPLRVFDALGSVAANLLCPSYSSPKEYGYENVGRAIASVARAKIKSLAETAGCATTTKHETGPKTGQTSETSRNSVAATLHIETTRIETQFDLKEKKKSKTNPNNDKKKKSIPTEANRPARKKTKQTNGTGYTERTIHINSPEEQARYVPKKWEQTTITPTLSLARKTDFSDFAEKNLGHYWDVISHNYECKFVMQHAVSMKKNFPHQDKRIEDKKPKIPSNMAPPKKNSSSTQKYLYAEFMAGKHLWDPKGGPMWDDESWVDDQIKIIEQLRWVRNNLGLRTPRDGWEEWSSFDEPADNYYLNLLRESESKRGRMHDEPTLKKMLYIQRLLLTMLMTPKVKDEDACARGIRALRDKKLFSCNALASLRFHDNGSLLKSDTEDMKQLSSLLFQMGTHNVKASDLVRASKVVVAYGEVKKDPLWIGALHGVAQKIRSVVMFYGFDTPHGVPTDSHVFAIARANRWVSHSDRDMESVALRLQSWVPVRLWHVINEEFASLGQILGRAKDTGSVAQFVDLLLRNPYTRQFIVRTCTCPQYVNKAYQYVESILQKEDSLRRLIVCYPTPPKTKAKRGSQPNANAKSKQIAPQKRGGSDSETAHEPDSDYVDDEAGDTVSRPLKQRDPTSRRPRKTRGKNASSDTTSERQDAKSHAQRRNPENERKLRHPNQDAETSDGEGEPPFIFVPDEVLQDPSDDSDVQQIHQIMDDFDEDESIN